MRRHHVFAVLAVLLALLVIEVSFRALVAIRTGPRALTYGVLPDREFRTSVDRHDEARAGYSKYRPHQELVDHDAETGERFVTRVNALGFRGDEITEKPPGGRRVLTLGASSTFGFHARDQETYPARLREELRRLCPGTPWQVVNLGIPHLLSDEILALFREEGVGLAPDAVVFYEGINDSSPRRERQGLRRRLHRATPVRRLYRALRERSLVIRFLDSVVRPRLGSYDRAKVDAHLSGRGDVFFQSLEALRDDCRRRGILFVVVTQQAKSTLVDRDAIAGVSYAEEERRVRAKLETEGALRPPELWFLAHAELMRNLREWAARNEVPLVDGIAALDAQREELVSWVHLTPRGNDLLARAIGPALATQLCPEHGR